MPRIAIGASDAMMRASSSMRGIRQLRRRWLVEIADAQHFPAHADEAIQQVPVL
jgi:hypothetical protein